MMKFEEKKFDIGELKGISPKNIEEHLKLYAGYVKHANHITERLEEMHKNNEDVYGRCELERRFGFEYNGMRNHEVYFDSLAGGAAALNPESELAKSITFLWGSYEQWLEQFKQIAMVRGVGWAMLYLDRKEHRLLMNWVDEQHIGQLQDCTLVLALDMWEHSFVADYQPSGKKQYVEDFFTNLNWSKVEENFNKAN